MIPVVSVEQMRCIDDRAISGNVAVGFSYMLRAGVGLYDAAKNMVPDRRVGEIAVICGKGNNGGDGFIVARLLIEAGYRVMCFGVAQANELTQEARMAYDQYLACDGNFLLLDDAEDICALSRYTLIIDALLGTGLKGDPHGIFAEIIEAVNQSGIPVLAVDTPSGLNNDIGVPAKPCIVATTTVTMGFPKIGAYFFPGKSVVGKYLVKDLHYPEEIVEKTNPRVFVPTPEKLKKLLPPRKPDGSKFDHGIVAMLCGSRGMTGSAVLASNSAMRTGCGMVHLFTPASVIPALCGSCIEVVMHGIAETETGRPSTAAAGIIGPFIEAAQSICIGPGISHEAQTAELVRRLCSTLTKPIILDADGINAFKDCFADLKNHRAPLLITPHKREWQRLFGELPKAPIDMVEALKTKAREYEMTILYKGAPTIVADFRDKAFIVPFGNSGMATAGCGDVLSGVIASLAAQGCNLTDAAVLGAYLHGEAGNSAARQFGEYGMIARDLIGAIPSVLKNLVQM